MTNSMLDTDLYIFTMGIFAKNKHSDIVAEYVFKCRNNVDLSILVGDIRNAVNEFIISSKFTHDEIDYLNTLFDGKAEYLREYVEKHLPIEFSDFVIDSVSNELIIRATGPLWAYIFIEVPLLFKVNETYNKLKYSESEVFDLYESGNTRLTAKIETLNNHPNIKIMEFGTRRRFSREWQNRVLTRLLTETTNVVGTSNVLLAKEHGITPLGTTAHLYSQVYQALTHPLDAQKTFFKEWAEFWENRFLIALTDIYPQQKFLMDFTKDLCEKYDGVRHDSGDPKVWVAEIIEHYRKNGIDPKTKKAIFSDGLDIPLCVEIYDEFGDQIQCVFGIGTNLTNDMGLGHNALQVVMKVVTVNGRAVAKISNNPGKSMCEDPEYVKWLIKSIHTEINQYVGGK